MGKYSKKLFPPPDFRQTVSSSLRFVPEGHFTGLSPLLLRIPSESPPFRNGGEREKIRSAELSTPEKSPYIACEIISLAFSIAFST
ncbi:MAG: hypothetical protein K2O69_03200, partial [Odoribacter sp.]|nr:hypothetical protein [Odoribacter sp.]